MIISEFDLKMMGYLAALVHDGFIEEFAVGKDGYGSWVARLMPPGEDAIRGKACQTIRGAVEAALEQAKHARSSARLDAGTAQPG